MAKGILIGMNATCLFVVLLSAVVWLFADGIESDLADMQEELRAEVLAARLTEFEQASVDLVGVLLAGTASGKSYLVSPPGPTSDQPISIVEVTE